MTFEALDNVHLGTLLLFLLMLIGWPFANVVDAAAN